MFPTSVDYACPFCKRYVTFSIHWPRDVNWAAMSTTARCSGCGKKPTFVYVDISRDLGNGTKAGTLYLYPPTPQRRPLPGLEEAHALPVALRKAYESAINVYNSREWNGAAGLARRALEGVVKTLVPESAKARSLAAQIEALPSHHDLQQPLLRLGHALRQAGNLGAHFDLEQEADEPTATLMLDLLDYLLEYLFVLPGQVERLESRIERLPEASQE